MRTILAVLALSTLSGCGGAPPARWVFERDVGPYSFRRFQHVLDVEVPIEGNDADGYTATYVRRVHDQLVVVTAFVTVYAHPASLTAEIGERVHALGTYDMSVGVVAGQHVWKLIGPDGDHWLLWVSGTRVVKLGTQNEEPPPELSSAYASMYASDLDDHGHARAGTASVGPSHRTVEERHEDDLPSSLREGAPR